MTDKPKGRAEFVQSFATGWPEDQPDLMILSLTTHEGKRDYALTAEQARLIARTIKDTAEHISKSGKSGRR